MRKALCPAHVMSESQRLESNPSTSGALEKSNHRGPGVPLLKIPGARISSFGGSSTCINLFHDRRYTTCTKEKQFNVYWYTFTLAHVRSAVAKRSWCVF